MCFPPSKKLSPADDLNKVPKPVLIKVFSLISILFKIKWKRALVL